MFKAAGAAAIAFALIAAAPASAARHDTELASRATGTAGAAADNPADNSQISADGRFIAFRSAANNLSTEDDDTFSNIFVRDLAADTTALVTRATGGAPANAFSTRPSISANGRFVTFNSVATNLSGADQDAVDDVFVRDLDAGTTTLVSRAGGPAGAGGNGSSDFPAISADGRYVAFQSDADNLSAGDDNLSRDVFVRDLVANTTALVSRETGAPGAIGDANSQSPTISADGNRVAFSSDADNLSIEDDNGANIFVRDLDSSATTFASRATGAAGVAANQDSGSPSISATGRFVAFSTAADNLSDADTDGTLDVFVRDLTADSTVLASRATGPSGAGGDASSNSPSISADGAHVAFGSEAENLSTEDDDGVRDVFVRDLVAGTTTLASRATGPSGAGGDQNTDDASISGDGRFVAFSSFADNLGGGGAGTFDVFRRTIGLDPPLNLAAPELSGTPLTDFPLTCSDGSWSEGAIARQWRRNGSPIPGATETAYTLQETDVGAVIDCLVTATNADGSTSQASNATLATPSLPGPPGKDGEMIVKLLALLSADKLKATGKKVTVRFTTSAGGRAEVAATKGSKEFSAETSFPGAGTQSVRLKVKKPGKYALDLTVTGTDGQMASDAAQLKVKRGRR